MCSMTTELETIIAWNRTIRRDQIGCGAKFSVSLIERVTGCRIHIHPDVIIARFPCQPHRQAKVIQPDDAHALTVIRHYSILTTVRQ